MNCVYADPLFTLSFTGNSCSGLTSYWSRVARMMVKVLTLEALTDQDYKYVCCLICL